MIVRALKWILSWGLIIDVFITSGFVVNAVQLLTVVFIWPISKSAYRKINAPLVRMHWDQLIWLVEWFAGIKVRIFGDQEYYDKYCGKEKMICICNHKSDVDWLLGWCFAHRFDCLGLTKCLMKKSNAFIPVLGWTWWFMEYTFLDRNWEKDKATLTKSFKAMNEFELPFWMVNFCEGTRYTAEKNAEARVFAKSRGYHEPEMTLFPRSKGFVATMHGLRKSVASVACTTFAFPEGKQPNFLSLLTGVGGEVHLLVRRYPIETLPQSDEQLGQWLRERWVEKDKLLSAFARNDCFTAGDLAGKNMIEVVKPRRPISVVITLFWNVLAVWALWWKVSKSIATGDYYHWWQSPMLIGLLCYKIFVATVIFFLVTWSMAKKVQAEKAKTS